MLSTRIRNYEMNSWRIAGIAKDRSAAILALLLFVVFWAATASPLQAMGPTDALPGVFQTQPDAYEPYENPLDPDTLMPARRPLQATASPVGQPLEEPVQARIHSPLKATMLSATLPGMGQAYNGKYYKIPVIYAGFATLGYFVKFNNDEYQMWRRAFLYRNDGNPNTVDDFPFHSTDVLQRAMNYYRRNLELTYILAGALYVLNILDATVDAHLLDFDVGDELSLKLQPALLPGVPGMNPFSKNTAGIKLSLRF